MTSEGQSSPPAGARQGRQGALRARSSVRRDQLEPTLGPRRRSRSPTRTRPAACLQTRSTKGWPTVAAGGRAGRAVAPPALPHPGHACPLFRPDGGHAPPSRTRRGRSGRVGWQTRNVARTLCSTLTLACSLTSGQRPTAGRRESEVSGDPWFGRARSRRVREPFGGEEGLSFSLACLPPARKLDARPPAPAGCQRHHLLLEDGGEVRSEEREGGRTCVLLHPVNQPRKPTRSRGQRLNELREASSSSSSSRRTQASRGRRRDVLGGDL